MILKRETALIARGTPAYRALSVALLVAGFATLTLLYWARSRVEPARVGGRGAWARGGWAGVAGFCALLGLAALAITIRLTQVGPIPDLSTEVERSAPIPGT